MTGNLHYQRIVFPVDSPFRKTFYQHDVNSVRAPNTLVRHGYHAQYQYPPCSVCRSFATEPFTVCSLHFASTTCCIKCITRMAQELIDVTNNPIRVGAFDRIRRYTQRADTQWTWLSDGSERYMRAIAARNTTQPFLPPSEEELMTREWDLSYWRFEEARRVQEIQASEALGLSVSSLDCCNSGKSIAKYHNALPEGLAQEYVLRCEWSRMYASDRRCCAWDDCGAFLPVWCEFRMWEQLGPPFWGLKLRRRMFCSMCKRVSEFPGRKDPQPVLAVAQSRFPWMARGHPALVRCEDEIPEEVWAKFVNPN